MSKLLSVAILVLALTCLFVIACQTTGTPPQSQPNTQSRAQPQAQSQAQTQGRLQSQLSSGSAAISRTVAYSKALGQAASTQLTSLIRKVDTLGKTRLKLLGVDLPPTEILAVTLAGVILLAGATWTLASRRLARRAS